LTAERMSEGERSELSLPLDYDVFFCFFFCISGLYSDGFWKSGQQRKRWLEMRFQ